MQSGEVMFKDREENRGVAMGKIVEMRPQGPHWFLHMSLVVLAARLEVVAFY
jgi:hypothetical protein